MRYIPEDVEFEVITTTPEEHENLLNAFKSKLARLGQSQVSVGSVHVYQGRAADHQQWLDGKSFQKSNTGEKNERT